MTTTQEIELLDLYFNQFIEEKYCFDIEYCCYLAEEIKKLEKKYLLNEQKIDMLRKKAFNAIKTK
ncbi:hypothetical protein [Cytobacillus gottheilii]|uniref:hypothetical protein n=1 Tax=Cytobacillus gottheilii TaxID=859144 RepID=UPI0024953511|nr:hypothetical protein [Cytobacillus gottheilii]